MFPWGLFVGFLSECQASAWVSKQTSSSRNDVSEKCHRLGMSCQSLCWANDYFWVQWELKVSNSSNILFLCLCYGLMTHVLLNFQCLDSGSLARSGCFDCCTLLQNRQNNHNTTKPLWCCGCRTGDINRLFCLFCNSVQQSKQPVRVLELDCKLALLQTIIFY